MTKYQMFKTNQEFWEFGFWKLEFVSDFDIRISNLFNPGNNLVPALPR